MVQPAPIVTFFPMKTFAGIPVGSAAAVWMTDPSPTDVKIPMLDFVS
jgi:hypothetical protein